MRILVTLAIGLLASSVCAQDAGIFQSYIVTTQNGSFSNGTSYGTSGNPNRGISGGNGTAGTLGTTGTIPDLGTYNVSLGHTLFLNGQVLTFKNGAGADVTETFLNYRIYPSGSPSGGYSSISLGFSSDAPFSDIGGQNFGNAGDQLWANGVPIDLIAASGFSGIGSQTYTLEVFFSANTSPNGNVFNSNNGGNYFATFTVVPEPATYLAGSLLVGLVGWQVRRRKTVTATA